MPLDKSKFTTTKFYFVYFIIFTVIVLIIFSFIIVGYSWNYWSLVTTMDKYYKGQQQELTRVSPQINRFDPSLGLTGAKVTVYEYTDFGCPACADWEKNSASLQKLYGNKVLFVYKSLPITNTAENLNATTAAYCASDQGKFWPYKDLIFQNLNNLNLQIYREYANQLGLDLEKFNQCYEAKKFNPVLTQNINDAINLQIVSIPTVYINDEKVEGYLNVDTLKKIIDAKLQ
ncbi:MAG: thioredoxin domain-containing protein [Patescibacteria group bacterium]